MKTSGIYAIKNLITGKVYIGSSNHIEQRWRSHLSSLRKNKHHSRYLQRSWNKHGERSFIFGILRKVEESLLIDEEQKAIDLYKSYDPVSGYNMSPTANSCLGYKHPDSFREGCRQRSIERYKDPEERRKTGEATKKALTNEKREKMSQRLRERWSRPEEVEKQRRKMKIMANDPEKAAKRDAKIKQRWATPGERERHRATSTNNKRIQHVETGIIYESISDATRKLPISKQTIKNNLSGKFKSRKGMNFKYVEKTP